MKTKMQRKKIKNPYETELRSLNASLDKIKSMINKPQKINVDTPLEIKVIEEKQKEKRKWPLFIMGVLLFFILTFSPYGEFKFNSPKIKEIKSKPGTIKGFIRYPTAVSPGDDEKIELMFTNDSKLILEEVKSFIVFPKKAIVRIASNKGSSVADFEKIDVNETKTKLLTFQLGKKPPDTDKMEIQLKITSKTVPEILETPCSISIPIHRLPRTRSIVSGFLDLLKFYIIIPILAYVGGYFKKRYFPA
jgi:hypothetical protein